MVDALLELKLADGHEVEVRRHRLPCDPVPRVEVLLIPRVSRFESAYADGLHSGRHSDRDVHQGRIRRMIIGGVPPRRAFWLSRDDPLAVSGQPWLYVALFDLARLTRVIDDDLERAADRDRLRGFDIDVGEVSGSYFRRQAIDRDLVGVQREVEVERVEPLSGLRADGRRASDRLSGRIPIDHDLILGDVVAAVTGLRVVRIA